MLLMLFLVLTTGLKLIIIPEVLVVFLSIVWLIFDIGFISKLWDLIDAITASKSHSKEF